jgi:hypothetical protein
VGFEPIELFSRVADRMVVRQYYDGRVRIGEQSGAGDMDTTRIKDVTEFMRTDVQEMNKQAEKLHETAMGVKSQFQTVIGEAQNQLDEAQKNLMELQAAMGLGSNFPPPSGEA